MAQRRIQETRTQDIQQRLARDSTLKANFESERRVDYMRRARMDDQRDAEWQMIQSYELVRYQRENLLLLSSFIIGRART